VTVVVNVCAPGRADSQVPEPPTETASPDVQATADRKATSTPFRPEDVRLFDALDAYAKSIRRSRNMAMNLLLEAAMEKEGLWPPAEPSAEDN
jgi:hypothetical protein